MIKLLLPLVLSPVGWDPGKAPRNPTEEDSPAPTSYAAIDDVLAWEYLVPPNAEWRYFVGVAEPTEVVDDLEWTKLEFIPYKWGDTPYKWSEGPAPFGFGEGPYGTELKEMQEKGLNSVYLRHILYVEDPGIYDLIEFECPVKDGFDFYVNESEEGRMYAGKSTVVPTFDKGASSERGIEVPPLPTDDITAAIKAGDNILALQGLKYPTGKDTFSIHPRVKGTFAIDPASEKARLEKLKPHLQGEENAAGLAYLEGRHFQRIGQPAAAIPHFEKATKLDPQGVEPWTRLVECHRELGQLADFEKTLRDDVRAGSAGTTELDVWTRVFLEDLQGSPNRIPGFATGVSQKPAEGYFADALYAGTELAEKRPLRVDCGARTERDGDGNLWSRDRFVTNGQAQALDGSLDGTVRLAERRLEDLAPLYRVPLAEGAYEVVLHFPANAPGEERTFTVFLDGARAKRGVSIGTEPVELRFPIRVADGFLEVDLVPDTNDSLTPRITAFEILPIEKERFFDLAQAWVAETGVTEAYPLVQFAESYLLLGQTENAFEALEEAELLADFRHEDQARLSQARDALLPEILSYATVDDLIARRPDDAAKLLADYRGVASGEEAEARAAYFEGRLFQEAGNLDEAIGFFEGIVFSDSKAPEPVLRMAECLHDSNLSPEAEGILREKLFGGVPATTELLTLWIAINLDELGRDPWDVVSELRDLDAPDVLVVVPTSEGAGREWQTTPDQPPSTTWSNPAFNADWPLGMGGIGSGKLENGETRTHWDTSAVYARQPFELYGRKLLYPHARVYFDGAGDVYLNGTRAERLSYTTDSYAEFPFRAGAFNRGENILGFYAVNGRYEAFADLGVVMPLAQLEWVLGELEKRGAIRLNCGGPDYIVEGQIWYRDRFFGHGAVPAIEPDPAELDIAGTEDDDLFRTQRWFRFSYEPDCWYRVPLPNGNYEVTLHWAEIDPEQKEPGLCTFDVSLEKEVVIEDFDVAREAGFAKVHSRSFDVTVEDGWLDVDFTRKVGDPYLSAIEIEKAE